MRRVFFVLLVVAGFVSVVVGAAVAFVNPLLNQLGGFSIPSSGTIATNGEESKVSGSGSRMLVDERGYLPMVVGVGLLSIAFLSRLVVKRRG